MADDRKVQLGFTVDSTGAKKGFDEVKAAGRDMAQSVTQAGQQASKGFDGIGTGGAQAAQSLDRSTKSIISSIQRTTATMEAGERGSVKYYEALASQRGANADALRPYLAQLEAATEKQNRARGSLDNMGMSAAQTANALRGVPAQLTDIVVSLQGGQAPLTVFLQQGGQLRDMFGSAGGAAKALGGAVLGLINPFTVGAAAAAALAVAYNQGSKEADAYRQALILTGNAAGTSTGQLADMAERIGQSVGTQGKAAEALAAMAGTGRIAAENLEHFGRVAVQMEQTVGRSAAQTAEDLAALGKAPLEASEKLNEKYRYLTAAVYDQIKALQDQGREEEAASLAQRTFMEAMDERTNTIKENIGTIERAYKGSISTIKDWWDAILNVGRADTLTDQIAAQKRVIADLESGAQNGNVAVATDHLKFLEAWKQAEKGAAELTAERQKREAAGIAWRKEGEKYLAKSAQMEREITQARNEGATAGASLAEIESRVAAIREKYAEKGKKATNSAIDDAKKLAATGAELSASLLAQNAGLSGDFAQKWASLTAAYKAGAISLKTLTAAQAELLSKQPAMVAGAKAEADALKDSAKAADDLARRYADLHKPLEDRALALETELDSYGKTEAQIAATTVARLEEARAMMDVSKASPEYLANLDREIAARKRIAAAAGSLEANKAADQTAKDAAAEWKRTADSIEQSLTDALMRGFESGEDFGENLKKSLVNMFKTLVLRPIVQPLAQGMAGMVTGQAPGGSGGNGLLGQAQNAYSLYNNASIGYQWATGSMSGANAAGTMWANTTGTGLDGLLATNGAYGTAAPAAGGAGATMAGWGGAGAGAYLGYRMTGGNYGGAALGGVAGYGAATGMATGAGAMAGTTAALAAIPVWGWIAIAALAIGSKYINGGTPHQGAAVFAGPDGATSPTSYAETLANYADPLAADGFGSKDFYKRRQQGMADALEPIAAGSAALVNNALAIFDQETKYRVGIAFSSDRDDKSRGALSILDADGSEVGGFSRKYDRKAERAIPQLADDIAGEVRTLLVSQMPDWADNMLADLGDKPSMEALEGMVGQIGAIKSAADLLGPSLGVTAEELAGLSESVGSIDAVVASLGAFADASLTAAEKWEIAQRSLADEFGALGLSVPQSTESFRALVSGVDLASEAGQELYANLINLAPAFYSVAGAVEAAFDAISTTTASSVRDIELSILDNAGKYAYLDTEIDRLLGDLATAADPAKIQSLFEQINGKTMQAYNLLESGEQSRLATQFIDRLHEAEALSQARLSVAPLPAQGEQAAAQADQQAEKIGAAVQKAVSDAMTAVADRLAAAGGDQAAAAGALRDAVASLPGRIVVSIDAAEVGR